MPYPRITTVGCAVATSSLSFSNPFPGLSKSKLARAVPRGVSALHPRLRIEHCAQETVRSAALRCSHKLLLAQSEYHPAGPLGPRRETRTVSLFLQQLGPQAS